MTLRPQDLPIGTRVRLITYPEGLQAASLGMDDLVVHVNAIPSITGTIHEERPHQAGRFVSFRPDGWPLPPGVYPSGFLVLSTDLEIIATDTKPEPCTITTRRGKAVSDEEAQRLIQNHLTKKG